MARRGKYHKWITEEGLTKIQGWARDGLVDEQIANNIGIHPSTLYDWLNKYPEIDEALKKGKEVIDREVENALLKRALGYDYTETKKESVLQYNEKGEIVGREMVVTEIKHKKQAPDTTAQIFWLKNRKPKEWRDKKHLEHEGSIPVVINNDMPKPE